MKKVLKGLVIGMVIIVAIMALVYCYIGFYYRGGFPCFTWVNGVYCTGKSVQEANNEIIASEPYTGIAVIAGEDDNLFVSASDVDMKIDYTDSLNALADNEHPLKWGVYLLGKRKYHFDPVVSLDRDKLKDIVSTWDIFVSPDDYRCRIVKDEGEGYILENAFITVPELDKVSDVVYDTMLKRESVADLSLHEECYRNVDLRGKAFDSVELFDKLDELQKLEVTYDIGGETIVFGSNDMSDILLTAEDLEDARSEKANRKVLGTGRFIIDGEEKQLPAEENIRVIDNILTDEKGNPIISEKKLYGFFEDIALKYDTGNLMDQYRRGETDTIYISKNSKGNGAIMDVSEEFEHLKDLLINSDDKSSESGSEVRQISLTDKIITVDAPKELGDTYIEVNMGDQILSYYVDGQLDMSFPIVTGNTGRGRGTPTGIYKVYNKRYHTYLRGADYVSYVNYWLGVYKGVGIHDATWRKKFGDNIYKTAGSHGCINCPLDQAEILWNKVEVDTPVILYY